MTITEHSFLTLHYRLSSLAGDDIINTFADKPATLSLGSGQLAPALEFYLLGLQEGAHQTFEVPREQAAFGQRNAELVQWVAKSLLHRLTQSKDSYMVGEVVQFPTPDGQATYAGVVQELGVDAVKFDFNHPLAGQPVRFEVKILGVL